MRNPAKAAHAIVALLLLLSSLSHVALATGSSPATPPRERDALLAEAGDGSAELSLPWATGETWSLTGGPHGNPTANALDFDVAGGAGQVRAAREGIAVIECPNTVRIDHVDGWSTLYAHVASIAIDNGQFVARGQIIGETSDLPSCSVGAAEGNHLHFAILRNGRPFDIQGMAIGGWTVQSGPRPYTGCLWRVDPPADGCHPPTEIENDGAIGSRESISCAFPMLVAPGFDAISRTRTIRFTWTSPGDCPLAAYDFRIKTVPDMESGGVTLADRRQINQTEQVETIDYQHYDRDLYWGVRASGLPDAGWSVRRFRIQPSVDTSPPAVAWKAPRQEDQAILAVEAGSVILRAKATDNLGVRVVEFVRWDGSGRKIVLGADTQPSATAEYSAAAAIANLELNWNLISAIAFDAAGNQTSQHLWLFRTTPGVPPISATIKSPAAGQLVSTTRAPISIAATDNVGSFGALTVEYQVDDGPFVPVPFASASGRYRTTWDTTVVGDGLHLLRARATDLAGRAVLSAPVEVVVDNVNILPVAEAGPDQRVIDVDASDGEFVELDGSASTHDPDLTATYEWFDRTSGSNVPLGSGQHLRFHFDIGLYSVRLLVTDSRGRSTTDDLGLIVDLPNGTPNDDFDRPEVIPALSFNTWMHVRTATEAADDPPMCVPVRRTVWFAFTAPADEWLSIDTEDSSYDSALAVFTGTRGQLQRVACDAAGWDSRVSLRATQGVTYYIMVGSAEARDTGFFELHLQLGRGSDDTITPNVWWIAPVVRWDSEADTKTIRSPTVLLSARAWDFESGLNFVQFNARWSGVWHNLVNVYEPSDSDVYTYEWDMCAAGVPDGDIQLGLHGYDKAGNETVYSRQWTNTHIEKRFACPQDTSPPALAFQIPVGNGQEFRAIDGVVMLRVQATDDGGVRRVVFERRNEANEVVPVATVDDRPYQAALTVDDLHMGQNQISAIAVDESGNATERTIRIVRERPVAVIGIVPQAGPVGAPLTVTLSRFPPLSSVPVLWDGNRRATVVTNESGEATTTFTVPPAVRGAHKIGAALGADSAAATFTVQPRIAVVPAAGPDGQTLEATLSGFVGGEAITLRWAAEDRPAKKVKKKGENSKHGKHKKGKRGKHGKDKRPRRPAGSMVAEATADAAGSATALFTIPAGATPRDYEIRASGSRDSSAVASYRYAPTAADTASVPSIPEATAPPVGNSSPTGVPGEAPARSAPSEGSTPAGERGKPNKNKKHKNHDRRGGKRTAKKGKRDHAKRPHHRHRTTNRNQR